MLFQFRLKAPQNTVFFSPLRLIVRLHRSQHNQEAHQPIGKPNVFLDIRSYQFWSYYFHHRRDILPKLLPIRFYQLPLFRGKENFRLVFSRHLNQLYFCGLHQKLPRLLLPDQLLFCAIHLLNEAIFLFQIEVISLQEFPSILPPLPKCFQP